MDQVVIFFVPVNATQRDFEAALRKHMPASGISETQNQPRAAYAARQGHEGSPLWTWFLPNPCPQRRDPLPERF
jgi:hypothetical protein